MILEAEARIHLANIQHNFLIARQAARGKKVMAVIKGNAYGHGAVQVARSLPQADAFGVARMKEAVRLREAGITQPVCLLEGILNGHEATAAVQYQLQLVVHSDYQLALLKGLKVEGVWIKVDTGMGRLGFPPERLQQICDELSGQQLLGVMTHLSSADESDPRPTLEQLARLEAIAGSYPLNVGNSAAILNHGLDSTHWIRPGVMLLGASPLEGLEPDPQLRPGMTLVAPIISVRDVRRGSTIGYGRTWCAEKDCRVAVVAVGYADGYPREVAGGTPVLAGGTLRTIVGRVSMDMISGLLEDGDDFAPGDPVTLWGDGLPIETIARAAGTIPYTLMSGLTGRVPRRYEVPRRYGVPRRYEETLQNGEVDGEV